MHIHGPHSLAARNSTIHSPKLCKNLGIGLPAQFIRISPYKIAAFYASNILQLVTTECIGDAARAMLYVQKLHIFMAKTLNEYAHNVDVMMPYAFELFYIHRVKSFITPDSLIHSSKSRNFMSQTFRSTPEHLFIGEMWYYISEMWINCCCGTYHSFYRKQCYRR